jgi:thiol-disulfide isomerase/thioredoxin
MKKIAFLCLLSASLAFSNDTLILSKEKTYVLSFFASWCPSCKKELPQLGKLHDGYKKRGIEIIGIDVDKKLEDAHKFQEKMKEHLPFKVLNDTSNTIVGEYKPLGMPAIFIVKNNEVCATIFGAEEHLEERLEKELQTCKEKK